MDDFQTSMWVYQAVATQAAAGGGTIQTKVDFDGRAKILTMLSGADNYAAAREVSSFLRDENNNISLMLCPVTAIDNNRVPLLWRAGAPTVDQAGDVTYHLLVGAGEQVFIITDALAQNETFTISIRALVLGTRRPAVTFDSSGTVTSVVAIDKLI